MIIRTIDDVLPHVRGRDDFLIADKGDFTVIDYLFAGADTFDEPMRLECRGLKFARDGRIIARPLRKFFNIGERPETQPDKLDFSAPHIVMEKLDGSMIHTAVLNGAVVFMTRGGRTDHAVRAEARHLTDAIRNVVRAASHLTLIFEWTAPDNRIVVAYEKSELTLLAARETITGRYLTTGELWPIARTCEVPLVKMYTPQHTTAADFLAHARAIRGAEGFVVRFASGLWVKTKGDDYVLKHKAKDQIFLEKNLLALALSGGLDDVLPLLDQSDAEKVRTYAENLDVGVSRTAKWLWERVANAEDMTQKQFATEFIPTIDPIYRPIAYRVRAGDQPHEIIRARIAANTNSQTQVDECRPLHGARLQ